MIARILVWLDCLFMGHALEGRGHPQDEVYESRAAWEDWQVCTRCGKDTREWWEIEDDNLIRLERIELELKSRGL